jgi:hypothetical protein
MGLARLLAKADADHVWCIAGFALEIATNDHFGFLFNGIRAWHADSDVIRPGIPR